MSADEPRIKRILKRYLKGDEFSDASLELTGITLEELQAACRCSPDELLESPRELDGYAIVCLASRMQMSFDASVYDYFIHAYAKREFCSEEQVPEDGLSVPCEDGPPTRIPLEEGLRWVSTRPKEGKENYVGVENDNPEPNT
jgi:hypothetical protein